MRRTTTGVKLAAAITTALVLSAALNQVFLEAIGDFSTGNQEQYVIDGYYYMYLGDAALGVSRKEGSTLYEASDSLRPNIHSAGIVFLGAITTAAVPWRHATPLLFVALFFLIASLLLMTGQVSWRVILLPFSALLPYLFIPSKDAFVILGILLIVLALLDWRFWALGALGGTLVFLARPDAFYLLVISCVVWYGVQKPTIGAMLVVGVLYAYVAMGRDFALAAAELFQISAVTAETAFCEVGPLQVCVESDRAPEPVYLMRLLTVALVPVKWAADFLELFFGPVSGAVAGALRTLYLAHLALFAYLWKTRQPVDRRTGAVRGILITFAMVYAAAYVSVLYFQLSRPLVLASSIAMIGLCLTRKPGITAMDGTESSVALPRHAQS